MSLWDDLTGKTAKKEAEKWAGMANSMQQDALQLQRDDFARQNGYWQGMQQTYQGMIDPITQLLYGISGAKSAGNYSGNPSLYTPAASAGSTSMMDTSNQNIQNFIDLLTGRTITKEQQNANAITQQYIDQLTGKTKTAEQEQADQWTQSYLNMLQNSPDTAFNAGVSNLAKTIQQQRNAVSNEMVKRGISGSGIDLAKIAGTESDRAAGMSQLQAQRLQQQLANTATGAEIANNLALNKNNGLAIAQQLTDNLAQRKQQNIGQAAEIGNNYTQQLMNNIMNMYGQQGNTVINRGNATNNLAGAYNNQAAQYQQTANQYQQAAANAAGSFGGIVGTILGGIVNPVGAAIGANIGKKITGGGD